jgi:hypothetical protein
MLRYQTHLQLGLLLAPVALPAVQQGRLLALLCRHKHSAM